MAKFFIMGKLFIIFFLIISPVYLQNRGYAQVKYGSNEGRYVEVSSNKLYYEVYGEGTPLLLLHGGMGSITSFEKVIPELSKHYKVIALDSPGHGRSEHIDSLSYQIMADYVVEFISKLELDNIYIAGYSDGAIIGLLAAHEIPEKIKKVVFGGGILSLEASTPQGMEILSNITPKNLPESFARGYREKSPNPEKWEQFVSDLKMMWLQNVWIPKSKLKNIKSRILILYGDRDEFIPLEHGLEIYKLIPGSELCILPNTYHSVYKDAALVTPILINFLSGE
jgi:pimeloyl-ACP methyl ester carboxylesterase